MEKRPTIKDIAQQSGFSIGTVHCALNGKPGVSQENRHRIVELARQLGYRPNSVAASLKRGKLRIGAAFPGPTEESRYYYSFIWAGVRDRIRSLGDFQVELVEAPFYSGVNSQSNELNSLLSGGNIDGLLTVGCTDSHGAGAVQAFVERGIPVVFVGNDNPRAGRLCCVQPDYTIIGRTMAELITGRISDDGGILLCAGEVAVPSHSLIVQGFDAYLAEKGKQNPVYKLHTDAITPSVRARFIQELTQRSGLAACCAVNARNSVLLGQTLLDTGMAGGLIAVGSDLCAETVDYLKHNVFHNILYKNPYQQADLAAKYLTDFLLRDERPPREVIHVGSEVLFESSLPMYDNGLFRILR